MDWMRARRVLIESLRPAPTLSDWLQIGFLLALVIGAAGVIAWFQGIVPGIVTVAVIGAFLFFLRAYRLQGILDSQLIRPTLLMRSKGWMRLDRKKGAWHFEVTISNPRDDKPWGIAGTLLEVRRGESVNQLRATRGPIDNHVFVDALPANLYLQPHESVSGQLIFVEPLEQGDANTFDSVIIILMDAAGNKFPYETPVDDLTVL